MKKLKKYSIILGIFLTVSLVFSIIFFMSRTNYQRVVSEFREISVSDIKKLKDSGDKVMIYVGKESCPACVEFAPKLLDAKKKVNIPIYYLDSTDSKTDKAFINFKLEYSITSVPTLICIEGDDITIPSVEDDVDGLADTLRALFEIRK